MKFRIGFGSKRAFDPYYQKRTDPIEDMIKSSNKKEDSKVYTKKEAFPLPFIGEYAGKGLAQFKLHEPFQYIDEDPNESVTVPIYDPAIDFKTDGGSIPPIAYFIVGSPWRGKYVEATIPHDWECHNAKTPEERKKADKKFLKMLRILKIAHWRKRVLYRGVRVGAYWKKVTGGFKK